MVTTLSDFDKTPRSKYQAARLETLSVLEKLIRAETRMFRIKDELLYVQTKKNSSSPMGDLMRMSNLKTQLLSANAKMLALKSKHMSAKIKEKELKPTKVSDLSLKVK